MMKRADRDAWCADLRANPDKQGRNYLSSETGDCCLGRLAKVLGIPTEKDPDHAEGALIFKFWIAEGEVNAEGEVITEGGVMEDEVFPPNPWLQEIGLDPDTAADLAVKNDTGRSFLEIADYIEQIVPVE